MRKLDVTVNMLRGLKYSISKLFYHLMNYVCPSEPLLPMLSNCESRRNVGQQTLELLKGYSPIATVVQILSNKHSNFYRGTQGHGY